MNTRIMNPDLKAELSAWACDARIADAVDDTPVDFHYSPHGSNIVLLFPRTDAAKAWVAEHIDDTAPVWCGGIAIGASYFEPIYDDLIDMYEFNVRYQP